MNNLSNRSPETLISKLQSIKASSLVDSGMWSGTQRNMRANTLIRLVDDTLDQDNLNASEYQSIAAMLDKINTDDAVDLGTSEYRQLRALINAAAASADGDATTSSAYFGLAESVAAMQSPAKEVFQDDFLKMLRDVDGARLSQTEKSQIIQNVNQKIGQWLSAPAGSKAQKAAEVSAALTQGIDEANRISFAQSGEAIRNTWSAFSPGAQTTREDIVNYLETMGRAVSVDGDPMALALGEGSVPRAFAALIDAIEKFDETRFPVGSTQPEQSWAGLAAKIKSATSDASNGSAELKKVEAQGLISWLSSKSYIDLGDATQISVGGTTYKLTDFLRKMQADARNPNVSETQFTKERLLGWYEKAVASYNGTQRRGETQVRNALKALSDTGALGKEVGQLGLATSADIRELTDMVATAMLGSYAAGGGINGKAPTAIQDFVEKINQRTADITKLVEGVQKIQEALKEDVVEALNGIAGAMETIQEILKDNQTSLEAKLDQVKGAVVNVESAVKALDLSVVVNVSPPPVVVLPPAAPAAASVKK